MAANAPQTQPQEPQKPGPRTWAVRAVIGTALLAGIIFGISKINYAFHHETTDNAQVEARLIPILPRVSGYVEKMYVEDYATVKKDSLLVEIDDADLQLQLQEMQANLVQAETDIENARASISNAAASLSLVKANREVVQTRREKAARDYQRDQNLYKEGAITQKQLEDSKANLDVNEKQYEAAENDVNVAQTKMAVLQAQLKKAESAIQLNQARIEQQKLKISYTKIYAPADGKIGKRNVDEGQYVQAGAPLFTIVNDSDYWVVANFKETQLGHIQPGREAEIKMDAFPHDLIKGKIVSISDATGARFSLLPPDNATGNFVKVTQRIPVKIALENGGQYKKLLRAGMSVEVAIPY